MAIGDYFPWWNTQSSTLDASDWTTTTTVSPSQTLQSNNMSTGVYSVTGGGPISITTSGSGLWYSSSSTQIMPQSIIGVIGTDPIEVSWHLSKKEYDRISDMMVEDLKQTEMREKNETLKDLYEQYLVAYKLIADSENVE